MAASRKEYTVALKKEGFFRSALDGHKQGSLNLHDKMVQYQILKRDAETNKQLYDGILQRLKETNISADLARSNVQVLDRADVPGVPFKPDRRKSLLNALMIGLLGGIGLGAGRKLPRQHHKNTGRGGEGPPPTLPGYRTPLPKTTELG